MILLLAVFAGLLAGLAKSKVDGYEYQPPELRLSIIVFIAVIPQVLIFQIESTSSWFDDVFAAVILVVSLLILLLFVIVNISQPGIWIIGLGLILNLIVISANNGFMPISPQTLADLIPNAPAGYWETGKRLGYGKDIVLTVANTAVPWLSDRFLLPSWFPMRVAYSLGDVFIAAGVFRLLWAQRDAHNEAH